MKVTNGYNQYAYQQQRTNSKDKSFADMLENMSANNSDKTESSSITRDSNEQVSQKNAEEDNHYNLLNDLTQEQIDDLKSRYGNDTLDKDQRKALGKELLDLGVISDKQYKIFEGFTTVAEGYIPVTLTEGISSDSPHRLQSNDDILIDFLLQNIDSHKYLLELLSDTESSTSYYRKYYQNSYSNSQMDITDRIESINSHISEMEKISSILNQLNE